MNTTYLIGIVLLVIGILVGGGLVYPKQASGPSVSPSPIFIPTPSPIFSALPTSVTSPTTQPTPAAASGSAVCSPQSTTFRCDFVTYGSLFDPNNPPPTVCGCMVQCLAGTFLNLRAEAGVWPDGSAKGVFTCEDEVPPAPAGSGI